MIVNFKEVEGRTISLDPHKGLMVNDVVVDPKNEDEKTLESIMEVEKDMPLMTENKCKSEKNKKQKLLMTMLGVVLIVGTSVLVLKGMKQNDN